MLGLSVDEHVDVCMRKKKVCPVLKTHRVCREMGDEDVFMWSDGGGWGHDFKVGQEMPVQMEQ